MNENFAVSGMDKRPSKTYKFKVRNNTYETPKQFITGREVLTTAGLIPPENYKLDLKTHGNNYREIVLDERVDLAEPGIEKFVAVPRDQYEG